MKIHKILIKKNFTFLQGVAEKRKIFYLLKELLYKTNKEEIKQRENEVVLDYSKSEIIDFDITQSVNQTDRSENEPVNKDVDKSISNLSDIDLKEFL